MIMRSLIVVVLLLAASSNARAKPIVVVLPLTSAAASPEAAAIVERLFAETLARRGWEVAPAADVESFLESERIRYLDSISQRHRKALEERFGASAIVVGSMMLFRENGANVLVALAGRMLNIEGDVLWGEVAALTAAETEGAFGIGRLTTAEGVTKAATQRLLGRIPSPNDSVDVRLKGRKLTGRPSTYRSALLPAGSVRRICVLPFTSAVPDASRIFLDILTVRLEATGQFDVVEPVEFREAMAAAGLRSVISLTSTELAVLGKHLGTTVFLRGHVHTFRDATGGRSEVQMDMNLSDVATGQILWAVTHQRHGSDYSGILSRGVVGNAVTLADRVLSETISMQHHTRPKERSGHAAAPKKGR